MLLGSLNALGHRITIGRGQLEIESQGGERLELIARTLRGLYRVSHEEEGGYAVEVVSIMELHRHMGHIAPASARKLIDDGLITGLTLDPNSSVEHCEACIYARATRQPVPKLRISEQAKNFGDEVHTNVWGPATVSTQGGRRYFVTFTDDATRYSTTFLLADKSTAPPSKSCAPTEGASTVHDTPQLNGIAERLNCTLAEKMRALLYMASLPKSLWGEALRHSTWLKNRTSTRALGGKTPWEALYGSPPDLSRLKRFGEAVWVHDPDGSKLDPCAREGCWIGFDIESRGHWVYFP